MSKNIITAMALMGLSQLVFSEVILEKVNIQSGAYILQKHPETGPVAIEDFKRNDIDVSINTIRPKAIDFDVKDVKHTLRNVRLVSLDNPNHPSVSLSHLKTDKQDDVIHASLTFNEPFTPHKHALKWALAKHDLAVLGMKNRSNILLKVVDEDFNNANRVQVKVDPIKDDFNYTLSPAQSGQVLPIGTLSHHPKERIVEINFANPAQNVRQVQPITGSIDVINEQPKYIPIEAKEGVITDPLLTNSQIVASVKQVDEDLNKIVIFYQDPQHQVRGLEIKNDDKKPKFIHQNVHSVKAGEYELVVESDVPLSHDATHINLILANDTVIKSIPFKTPVLNVPKPVVL